MTDSKPTITPEALKLLAERAGLKLLPIELEQLCPAYAALERMKALIRKPRSYDSELAHVFKLANQEVDF